MSDPVVDPAAAPEITREDYLAWHTRVRDPDSPIICQICGSEAWSIGDRPFMLVEFLGASRIFSDGKLGAFPVVTLSCQRCGNTLLINAITAGMLDPQEPTGA